MMYQVKNKVNAIVLTLWILFRKLAKKRRCAWTSGF